jgi:Tol biopolymer transport system component
LTHHASGIQSAFNWHPSGEWLGFVLEDRIACCHAGTGDITFNRGACSCASADAIVFSPDGKQIAWMEEVDGYRQLWVTQTGR